MLFPLTESSPALIHLIENYIQSQANRNVVSQASQMGDKGHFFNFLNQDIEIFTHSWHT